MNWLLILLAVVAALSPLMMMRSTPGQKRAMAFRHRARKLGARVQLVPAAEAPESERRPSTVRYLMPWPQGHRPPGDSPLWILLRSDHRGWPSPWRGWRWFRREAPDSCRDVIARAVGALPESVIALRQDREGIAAYLKETGDIARVDQVVSALTMIRDESFSLDLSP